MEVRRGTTAEEREQLARVGHIEMSNDPIEYYDRLERQTLAFENCTVKSTYLEVKDNISFKSWQEIGKILQQIHGSVGWWIGDWLNYGEKNYGETYTQALEVTDKDIATLQNYKYVASAIESSRRREHVSWSAHREIAKLDGYEQDRMLEEIEKENLSIKEIRERFSSKEPTKELPPELPLYFVEKCLANKSGTIHIEAHGQKLTLSLVKEKVVSEDGALINELIGQFEAINPTFEQLYKRNSERAALQRLIAKFGEERVREMINQLPGIINQPYAPTVTSPVQLETNLGKLVAYVNKQKGDHGKTLDLREI